MFFFLKILDDLNVSSDESLTLITSEFHLKRCKELIERVIGSTRKIYYHAAADGYTDLENWYKTKKGKMIILREALLLCYYAKRKIIEDLEVEELSFKKR